MGRTRGGTPSGVIRLFRLSLSGSLLIGVLSGAVLSATEGVASASAGVAPVISNGMASYSPGSETEDVFDVMTLVTGGVTKVNPASLTIVTQPPVSDGAATAPTTSKAGYITFTPAKTAIGSFDLKFGYAAPGKSFARTSPTSTEATLSYEPGVEQRVGDHVNFGLLGLGSFTYYETIAAAVTAPHALPRDSTARIDIAPSPIEVPTSFGSAKGTAASGFTEIMEFPANLTYVTGSLGEQGGTATSAGSTTINYCTKTTATGCTAKVDTGNYKTTYPYIEFHVATSASIKAGTAITLPTATFKVKATGALTSTGSFTLTEYKMTEKVTALLGLGLVHTDARIDAWPTSGPKGKPPYATPVDLASVKVVPGTVTNVTPASGPSSGGTKVTIEGTGFTDATSVTFGGATASTLTVVSPTKLTIKSPVCTK